MSLMLLLGELDCVFRLLRDDLIEPVVLGLTLFWFLFLLLFLLSWFFCLLGRLICIL